MEQISWASMQAERSRNQLTGDGPRPSNDTDQRHPNGNVCLNATKEEEMLEALLTANQALSDAAQLRDDWQRAAVAAREERDVQERSCYETRIDCLVSTLGDTFVTCSTDPLVISNCASLRTALIIR